MTPEDFKRIALSFEGTEQGSHMGVVDFRVAGRIFATLPSKMKGYGNLALSPEQQVAFCAELPKVFIPIDGGWGRAGMTHVALAETNEDLLRGALEAAWRFRMKMNKTTVKGN
jgi:hypothetical protein